jgi:hypothetical protein
MAVIPLTLVISLCLVFTFVIFFLREQSFSRRRFSSAESEALLPLADETPRIVPSGVSRRVGRSPDLEHGQDHDHEDHAHAQGGNCGCKDGSRPPCPGCLRRGES